MPILSQLLTLLQVNLLVFETLSIDRVLIKEQFYGKNHAENVHQKLVPETLSIDRVLSKEQFYGKNHAENVHQMLVPENH